MTVIGRKTRKYSDNKEEEKPKVSTEEGRKENLRAVSLFFKQLIFPNHTPASPDRSQQKLVKTAFMTEKVTVLALGSGCPE